MRPLDHAIPRPSFRTSAGPKPLEASVADELVHDVARVAPRRRGARVHVALKRDAFANRIAPRLHDERTQRPKVPLQPSKSSENILRSLARRVVQKPVTRGSAHKTHGVTIPHAVRACLLARLVHVELEDPQHHRRYRPWRRARRSGHRLRQPACVALEVAASKQAALIAELAVQVTPIQRGDALV